MRPCVLRSRLFLTGVPRARRGPNPSAVAIAQTVATRPARTRPVRAIGTQPPGPELPGHSGDSAAVGPARSIATHVYSQLAPVTRPVYPVYREWLTNEGYEHLLE